MSTAPLFRLLSGAAASLAVSFVVLAVASASPVPVTPLPLSPTVEINGIFVDSAKPPVGLVTRADWGLVGVRALGGQVVHRTSTRILETRAVKTPKGDYLLMFPEGDHYGNSNGKRVNTMIAYRSSDQGATWSGPTDAFNIDYNQHGFIPLIPKGTKRIYAFGTQPIPGKYSLENGHQEDAPIGFRWSDDDGHTWSDVSLIRPINDPDYLGMSVMRMAETDAGTWLLGTHNSTKNTAFARQYILRSTDHGATWTILPGAHPGGWFVKGNRMDEGRPITLANGSIFLMGRTLEGHLWTSRSTDDGQTWRPFRSSSLVHPAAPPMLFLLSDGKTLIAFHHNRTPAVTSGPEAAAANMRVRSEIWFSLSKDDGDTWSEPQFLFANAASADLTSKAFNYQCSYLDMFVDGGVLHIFVPHRWQQVLHLTLPESALKQCYTKAQLQAAVAVVGK